jgi:hypothetical protein
LFLRSAARPHSTEFDRDGGAETQSPPTKRQRRPANYFFLAGFFAAFFAGFFAVLRAALAKVLLLSVLSRFGSTLV